MDNEILTEPQQGKRKQAQTNLTKEQLQALLSTMYSRALSSDEVNTLLTNTNTVSLVYHSTFGGLDIIDSTRSMTADGSHILISFRGRGNLDIFECEKILHILNNHKPAALEIYELFANGLLTLERGEIKRELYSEYYNNQPNKSLNNSNMKTADGNTMKNDYIL